MAVEKTPGVVTLPLKVKSRDAPGGPATSCDSAAKALEVAAAFRRKGFGDVWIEDADGRPVSEDALQNA